MSEVGSKKSEIAQNCVSFPCHQRCNRNKRRICTLNMREIFGQMATTKFKVLVYSGKQHCILACSLRRRSSFMEPIMQSSRRFTNSMHIHCSGEISELWSSSLLYGPINSDSGSQPILKLWHSCSLAKVAARTMVDKTKLSVL